MTVTESHKEIAISYQAEHEEECLLLASEFDAAAKPRRGQISRSTALAAARLAGAIGDARFGAFVLGLWSVLPSWNGRRTMVRIQSFLEEVGPGYTLDACYSSGRAFAIGMTAGLREGAAEIIEWVTESDTLEEAKKVSGWKDE